MKVSYVLIALLVAIVSIGAVCAATNDTAVDNTDVNPGDDQDQEITNNDTPAAETNVTDVPAAGDNVTDAGNATNTTTNTTNTTADLNNDNSTATSMLETGLPVVALILVVLAAVGLYRRD